MTGTDSSVYRPSLEQVASVIWARTKNSGGVQLGTFDDTTRPTGDQVENLIDLALSDAAASLGQDIPADLWAGVTMLVAIGTANVIQASYWPEQVGQNSTVFDYWTNWYEMGLTKMALAVRAINDGDGEGADGIADLPMWGDSLGCPASGAETDYADLWNSWVRSPAALSLSYDQLPLWVRRQMQI